MLRRTNTEQFVGEISIAVGLSMLFPSASVLFSATERYDLARPIWAGATMALGALLIVVSARRVRAWRLATLGAAFLAWALMLGVYLMKMQATPMAFVSLVILHRIGIRWKEVWTA